MPFSIESRDWNYKTEQIASFYAFPFPSDKWQMALW